MTGLGGPQWRRRLSARWVKGVIVTMALLSSNPAVSAETKAPPLSLEDYRRFFDRVYRENVDSLNTMADRGNGYPYYSFSYILEGMLAMFEATGHVRYLEQALRWSEIMVSKATIEDTNHKQNWSGKWSSPFASRPIAYMLEDLQGAAPLGRLSRVILTDTALRAQYGPRARTIHGFVKDHIVDKHLDRAAYWFRNNATDTSKHFSDKTAFLVRLLLDLHAVEGTDRYLSFARELLSGFKSRLVTYRDSLAWDLKTTGGAMDTSHANRYPYMAVEAYEAGIIITRED
jgi:hypothetical protein